MASDPDAPEPPAPDQPDADAEPTPAVARPARPRAPAKRAAKTPPPVAAEPAAQAQASEPATARPKRPRTATPRRKPSAEAAPAAPETAPDPTPTPARKPRPRKPRAPAPESLPAAAEPVTPPPPAPDAVAADAPYEINTAPDANDSSAAAEDLSVETAVAAAPEGRRMFWANVLAFVAILCLGGGLFWVLPRQAISRDEKRRLTPPPALTLAALFDGSYEGKTELFYNDNFPGRDDWIAAANYLKQWRGFASRDIQVFSQPNAGAAGPRDDLAPPDPQFTPVDADYQKIRALVVVNGRAVQIFGATRNTLAPFVAMIGKYREVLGPDRKIYVLAIPVGSDLYLPRQVNNGALKEKENIDLLYSELPEGVIPVRAYEAIAPHREEYIQFRTDHHWTGRGAYYAYRAFARAAGFTPLELSQMSYGRTSGPFLGTLYYYTRSPELAANPDYVEYWKVPGADDMTVTIFRSGFEKGVRGRVYAESAKGGNSYGVFIGGDFALTRIETGRTTGRKILVVKDSFGNALVPYLTAHYDEVFVIDYRYFKGNIPQLMDYYGIGELLYAHNDFFMNSKNTAMRGTLMLERGQR